MVRRLVQYDKIGLAEHQLRQRYASALASRQRGYLLEHLITCEEKCSQRTAYSGIIHIRICVLQLVKYGLVIVEIVLLLIIVGDHHAGTEGDAPGIRLKQSCQHLEYSGLACAVVSDDAHMLAALEFKAQIRKKRLRTEALGDVLDTQDVLARRSGLLEMQLHIRFLLGGLFQTVELVQQLDAALRALDGLFPVVGPELFDDRLLMTDHVLLLLICLESGIPQHLLLGHIVGVVADIALYLPAVDIYHLGGYLIEEIPVMRYDDDCPRVVEQISLEPLYRAQIQMVRRLVKEDDIGAGDEYLAKKQAGFLTAGESADLLVKVRLGKAKSLEYADRAAAGRVSVCLLVRMIEAVIALVQSCKLVLSGSIHELVQLCHIAFQLQDRLDHAIHLLEDRIVAVDIIDLAQISECGAAFQCNTAAVCGQLAGEYIEQGGLARAVVADDGDLFMLIYQKCGIPYDVIIPEGFCDM